LTRLKRNQLLIEFINDLVIHGEIRLLSVRPGEIVLVVEVMDRFNIDFDDGYQYVIAEQHNLEIISFDRDFDKTPLGRKTPAEILARA
jgi:predicted nucleic acid-binding protein